MPHSQQLQEKVATMLRKGEEYAVVKAEGQPVVVSIAIPDARNSKVVIICRSIDDYVKPFHKARREIFSESPEEFAIRIADDQFDSIKLANPDTKAVLVLSEYDERRLSRRDGRRIAKHSDAVLINEEIEKLPEILTEEGC